VDFSTSESVDFNDVSGDARARREPGPGSSYEPCSRRGSGVCSNFRSFAARRSRFSDAAAPVIQAGPAMDARAMPLCKNDMGFVGQT
jgi:hypothetical protein